MEPSNWPAPRRFQWTRSSGEYLAAHDDPRTVVTDEQARYFGTPLEERSLVPGVKPLLGSTRFADRLNRTAPQHSTA